MVNPALVIIHEHETREHEDFKKIFKKRRYEI
jgi:hypothetical protein